MNIPLKEYWNLLVAYLRTQRIRVLGLALLLSGSIALQLLTPQLMRKFIDAALAGAVVERLVLLAAFFLD